MRISGARAPRAWAGVPAVVMAALLWSLSGSLIKVLHQGEAGVPGIAIACYRALIAAAILLPFTVRHWPDLRRRPLAWRVASVAAFTVMTGTFVVATTRTSAASVILLQYTAPVFVMLLSPLLLRERAQRADVVTLACAMAGVAIMFLGNPASDLPALALATTSGAAYGVLTIALRRLRGASAVALMGMNCLGSGVAMLPIVMLMGAWRVPPTQLALVGAFGFVSFLLPYLFFAWGLRTVEAHRASLISLLEAGLNPVWTWLAVREPVPPATLAGGPLILLGVVIGLVAAIRRSRRGGDTAG